MLETYIQELGAAEILVRFPPQVRHRVVSLGRPFAFFMAACNQAQGTPRHAGPSRPPEEVRLGTLSEFEVADAPAAD